MVFNSLKIKRKKLHRHIKDKVQIKLDSNQYSLLPSSRTAKPVPKNKAANMIPMKSILFHKYSFLSKSASFNTRTPMISEKGALTKNTNLHPISSLIQPPI